jgi:hypothetical protein
MRLSKSRILAGLQCNKRLYLKLNRPELAMIKKSPLFETGILVGEQARKEFPSGVLVDRFHPGADPFAQTQKYLTDKEVNVIFEAGFRYGQIDVFVDVLQRSGTKWNLIEVKSSSSVKDDYIDDVGIQYLVLTNAGVAIDRIELMYLNKYFVYETAGVYDSLFIREDIAERVIAHQHSLCDVIAQVQQDIADAQEPVCHVDGHCNHPYPCEFKKYCEQQDGEYPLSWLPNAAVIVRKLHDRGIYDIRDIPLAMLSSETHRKVRRITLAGKAELEPAAADILRALAYPRYYLDFETVNFAVPVWLGTKPDQQLPFQWSCHIQQQDNSVEHKDFLDVSGQDPRREFAESLIAACGADGPVIVYNQTFEKGIIKALAREYNDLREPLLAINSRVFDLYPVMNKYYYHPAMKGSWSIKSVLTCLLPELSYSDLGAVQDGLMAQSAYHQIRSGRLTAEETAALTADMRDYCCLDTYAMLAIVERVCA